MMENNKFSNLDLDLVNEKEKDLLSVINANNISERIEERFLVEDKELENIVQIDEVNLDNKSERSEKSTMSRQDITEMVGGMISENNNIINAKFDDMRIDINVLRGDMLDMNNNVNKRFNELNDKFENMFNTMMAKLSSTSFQKVSDDHPMSEHIGNFIKDPNLIDTNVKQLVEQTVESKVGELAGKVKVFEEFYQQESRTGIAQ